VGDRHETDSAAVELRVERGEVDDAVLVIGQEHHLGAGALHDQAHGHGVARVLGARRQDPVAGAERHRVEGHVPGTRRALREGDLALLRAEQAGDRGVGAIEQPFHGLGGLVAAHRRLAVELLVHHVEHWLRHERGAGIVQVQHELAARREPPGPSDVDRHPSSSASSFFGATTR
jgi:hypothetical protein